jgi:putative ABC transport system permease protein
MIRLARELLGRPKRVVLTSSAAAAGIALIAGTLVLTDTTDRAGGGDRAVAQTTDIMLLGGGVALLVGMFIISTTFSVVLAQRARELALLRCLGAEVRQIRRLVRWEALALGLVASLIGLLLGIVAAAGLREIAASSLTAGSAGGFGEGQLVVSPRTILISLVVGPLAFVVAGMAPARQASRVAPLEALRPDGSARPGSRGRFRLVLGGLLLLCAVGVPVGFAGVGYVLLPCAAAALMGLRLAGPWLLPRMAAILGLGCAAWPVCQACSHGRTSSASRIGRRRWPLPC